MNEIWSVEFVADALFDGRRLRALTVIDNCTRECLAFATQALNHSERTSP
jgi:putative transposase